VGWAPVTTGAHFKSGVKRERVMDDNRGDDEKTNQQRLIRVNTNRKWMIKTSTIIVTSVHRNCSIGIFTNSSVDM